MTATPAVPISSTDKAVAAAFAMFVGWDGRAYPSAETVAEMALMSERTVRQSLLRLEAQGYLRVISRGGVGGSARSLLREITTPEPPAAVSLATPEPPAAVSLATPPLLAEVIGRALLALVHNREFKDPPAFAISRQAEVPIATPPKDVPKQFRHLVGEHPDHPGTGAGPRPRSD